MVTVSVQEGGGGKTVLSGRGGRRAGVVLFKCFVSLWFVWYSSTLVPSRSFPWSILPAYSRYRGYFPPKFPLKPANSPTHKNPTDRLTPNWTAVCTKNISQRTHVRGRLLPRHANPCTTIKAPDSNTLREEHEEGNHEREEANRLRQGEAQDGVVEQSPHQVRLAGGGEQEAAEHVTDTNTDTGKRDRRQTCC